jgi:hypothetical protein
MVLKCPYCEFYGTNSIQIFRHARSLHAPRQWMHVARMTDAELGSFFQMEEDAL